MVFSYIPSPVRRHTINIFADHDVITAMKRNVRSCEDAKAIWRARSSFVGLAQVYSDNLQTTMKASGVSLYPLHIPSLNVNDEVRRKLIVGGDTTFTYFPCRFSIDNKVSKDGVYALLKSDQFDHVESVKTVQDVVHDILSPFVNKLYEGLCFVDNSGRSLHCHAVSDTYPTDNSETEDSSSVKYRNVTDIP